MEDVYEQIRLMLLEGKSQSDIVRYLVAVCGMDQTIANATVIRVKESLDDKGNFKEYSLKQKEKENRIWGIMVIVVAILAAIGVLISVSNKVQVLFDAIFGNPL